VENQGPPIAETSLPHLFEPFWRGDRCETNRRGLGLGLFITREIVRAHGGEITVASSEPRTVFKLTLPRRP
jgi:signal transduction histidine kinase